MKSLIYKLLLVAICLVVSTSAFAAPVVDGFLGAGANPNGTEYANSFTTGWHNAHNGAGTIFPEGGGHADTNVYWESNDDYFWLYIEAPLEAKNMIWGNGVTEAEALLYYQHFGPPHHSLPGGTIPGDPDFLDKMQDELGFTHRMADSEKLVFGGMTANLADDIGAVTGEPTTLLLYEDSVDYVLGRYPSGTPRNGADETNSNNPDIPMAFEFKFAYGTTTEKSDMDAFMDLFDDNSSLEFHLSPERGGIADGGNGDPIPEPATVALLGIGLAGLAGAEVRRRRKKKAVDNS